MSHILVHEPRGQRSEWYRSLQDGGHEVVRCAERHEVLDALAARRPDVIVYALGNLALDLGVMSLVRRIAPTLPIIVLSGPTGLDARRHVQELRPVYFGVFPLDPAELCEAVRGALSHDGRGAIAS